MNNTEQEILKEKTIRELVDKEMATGKHEFKYRAMAEVAKRIGMNEQTLNLKYYSGSKAVYNKYSSAFKQGYQLAQKETAEKVRLLKEFMKVTESEEGDYEDMWTILYGEINKIFNEDKK